MSLYDLESRIRNCKLCNLSKSRIKSVPGVGSTRAFLMFVGEGPGSEEDIQGLPFVGAAGKYLDKILHILELRREEVFITNIVKCRPPNNRVPDLTERRACFNYLKEQILIIKPKIIVALGNTSLTTLTDDKSISKAHGKIIRKETWIIYPMYHPAAILHNPNLKEILFSDTLKLKEILKPDSKYFDFFDKKIDDFF